jgi:hypothetical protein
MGVVAAAAVAAGWDNAPVTNQRRRPGCGSPVALATKRRERGGGAAGPRGLKQTHHAPAVGPGRVRAVDQAEARDRAAEAGARG